MRLGSLLLWDIRFQVKYGFYFLYAVLTAIYVAALFAIPESIKEKTAAILIFSDPASMGLFFMGAIVLLEKSQCTPCAFAVSPVLAEEYVVAKAASLAAISLVVAAVLSLAVNVNRLQMPLPAAATSSVVFTLLGTVMASVLFTLLGIMIATKINSLNQFLLWTVPIEAACFVPAILHLFKITPSWFRYYPMNVCMDMILGHAPSAMGIVSVIILTAILFLFSKKCVLKMLSSMRRDKMLFAACLVPVLAGLCLRFALPFLEAALTDWLSVQTILSPYYKLIDVLYAMLSPVMFCFASTMVSLEETDEKTVLYLFITPLGKTGYFLARLAVPAAAAFLATIILLPVFKLTAFSPIAILLFAAGGTLQGVMVALLILTFSSNKLEGMAVSKLSSLILFGAVIPFFIKGSLQYALFPLPSFWMGKAACGNRLSYILPAFALSGIWIFFLLKRYLAD